MEQPTQQLCGGGERRVGHHVEGPAGQPEIADIGPNDGDGVDLAEASVEHPETGPVQLHRDDPMTGCDEGRGDHSVAGTGVDHQRSRRQTGIGDQSLSGAPVESVPPPPLVPGHG